MPFDLNSYLESAGGLIEQRLAGYLHAEAGAPAKLLEAMRYSLLAPGKRLRPILVLMAAEACGGKTEDALPAACAVEMIHAYSLVHDDLPAMDDDDLRRGRPTCHKQFDEATAILVGDALLTLAFQVLSEDIQPPGLAAACCQELARAAGPTGMIGGQIDDLASEHTSGASMAVLQSIHERKTGALFRAALHLGGLIGTQLSSTPQAKEWLTAIDGYGGALGLAFQISDDLLDVEGHAEQAGKRLGKDAGQGKLTYPGLLGVAESRARLDQTCREAVAHLEPLGNAAGPLALLVEHVRLRNR